MRRDRRLPVVLSKREREALQQFAQKEALSTAAVMRRLIIYEAKRRGLWPKLEGDGVRPLRDTANTDQSKEETSST